MIEPPMSKEQRFGLHAVLIAASLNYLTEQTEWISFLKNLEKSINVLQSEWLLQEVALNEEPIYVAGRILQISEDRIDELPEQKWLDYHKMLDDIKYVGLHERVWRVFEMLGSDPSAKHASKIEISIVPLDLHQGETFRKV